MRHLHPKTLADFQSGRLGPAGRASVEEHLEGCKDCRVASMRVTSARQTLRDIAEATVPVQSTVSQARMEATLRWTRSHRRARPRSRFVWGGTGFALAAAAAVALFVWRPWRAPAPHDGGTAAKAIAPTEKSEKMIASTLPQRLEALVTLVGGEAKLSRGTAAPARLDPLARLTGGDRITTAEGGRVGLQWGEGSGALVGSSSELSLARLDGKAQDLQLTRGQVSVRVGPFQPGEALRVLSPDHVITVHGTWFSVYVDAHGTRVEVVEGEVEVSSLDGEDSSTRMRAPQQAYFQRGKGVGEQSRALSARETAGFRLANEGGLLPWSSVDKLFLGTGMLDIGSTPPASLAVDGVTFGSTPLDLRRPRGKHLVELSRPGFATVSRWITVGDEPGDLHVALRSEADRPSVTPPGPDEAKEVMRGRKRQIQACYERSLKRNPNLAGTVTLQIKIGAAGQVLGTTVENDTLNAPEVAGCLRREAAGWLFAHARNATVVYPFVFRY